MVPLQNATATFTQVDFLVSESIDGLLTPTSGPHGGWAVGNPGGGANASTAVFETVSDIGFGGGTLLSLTLTQLYTGSSYALGRFRLSITTDNRSTFADGLDNGGDVTATWSVLSLTSLSASSGATLTVQGDSSVLVSGTLPATDIYTFSAVTGVTGITGIRLEALADASLPGGGPGRGFNGNFVLTEFALTATAIPEPSTWAALAGLVGLGVAVFRRRLA